MRLSRLAIHICIGIYIFVYTCKYLYIMQYIYISYKYVYYVLCFYILPCHRRYPYYSCPWLGEKLWHGEAQWRKRDATPISRVRPPIHPSRLRKQACRFIWPEYLRGLNRRSSCPSPRSRFPYIYIYICGLWRLNCAINYTVKKRVKKTSGINKNSKKRIYIYIYVLGDDPGHE